MRFRLHKMNMKPAIIRAVKIPKTIPNIRANLTEDNLSVSQPLQKKLYVETKTHAPVTKTTTGLSR